MRTRRVTRFAAPLVLVVACGSPAPVDDSDAASVPIDANQYATENPPAPCNYNQRGYCEECLVHVAPGVTWSLGEQQVCAVDPSCCTTDWGEQCTRIAASELGTCEMDVTFGGEGGVTVVDGSGTGRKISISDGRVESAAWGDLHGEGWPELATVGECEAKIFLALETTLVDAIDIAPVPGCVVGEVGPKFDGRRVRWTDLDHDLDLDVLYVGAGALGWIRQDAGGFSDGGALIAPADGTPSDAITTDLDGDLDLDLIVTFDDHPARIYRQGVPGTFALDDTWSGALPAASRVALCWNILFMVGPTGVEAARLEGEGVGGAAFPPGPGIAGVGPSLDVACVGVGAGFLETAGAVVVVSLGSEIWRSDEGVSPRTFDGRGLAGGRVDIDYREDVVVSVGGPDAAYVLISDAYATEPVITDGIDVAPGLETARVVIGTTSAFR